MKDNISLIEVRIWGMSVGALSLDPRTQFYVFEYDNKFVKKGVELAPLQMPIKNATNIFSFPMLAEQSFARLPALFADSLPDKFGNSLIDAYMATKGFHPQNLTPLDRLAYMGKRAMGALEFHPVLEGRQQNNIPQILELSHLVEQARLALQGNLNSDTNSQNALSEILQVGTSAGGARAKAVVAIHPQSQNIISGQFDIPEGYEHWLLKFDGVGEDVELGSSSDYGRIEYTYSLMAKEAGIQMEACALLNEEQRSHFMTRRFDRSGNVRHHIQSLCAMAHLDFNMSQTHDYNQLFMTAYSLGLGEVSLEQLFRRMVFNVYGANRDDHTKNFAFILKQNSRWELAPAFDVTYAYNPNGRWTRFHQMSVQGKFDQIQDQDLLKVAERFKISAAPEILRQIEMIFRSWGDFAQTTQIKERVKDKIHQNLTHILNHK